MIEGLVPGRIVHFIDDDATHLAAIVSAVHPDDTVNLCVFDPCGRPMWRVNKVQDPTLASPGTWHFIER